MSFQTGHESPNRGKIITTRALLWDEIQKLKAVVANHPRDKALLALSLGTGMRASDLSALRWDSLTDDGERFTALIRQKKTSKLKYVVLNPEVSAALREWRELGRTEWVIEGQRGGQMAVGSIARLVKDWATRAGIDTRNVASHSLRKARARALIEVFKEPLYLIMRDLGHASELQTSNYLGITTKDQARLYEHAL